MRNRHLLDGRTPLSLRACKTEAERIFELYLAEFRQAPEAPSALHKRYFSIYPFEKEALQNDTIQIVRRNFIWEFKYIMIREDRLIGLQRQPASPSLATYKDRERVEITTRRYYQADEPGGTIHYLRLSAQGTHSLTQTNTREAVTLAEGLLAAFHNDADQ